MSFDVVDLGETDHVAEGETAPDFTRPLVSADGWENVALSALAADGRVLLVFYPLNWGGKSVYTWNEIRDRDWGGDDLTVVGVGVSQPFDHVRFIEAREMDYALYSDPQNGVAEAYGVVHDLDGMAGVSEPRPAVFLLDSTLTVEYAWVATGWPERPPYDEIENRF
ncbi:MAG: redoxin domain-containing protein [Haloferacaceae archaeon]